MQAKITIELIADGNTPQMIYRVLEGLERAFAVTPAMPVAPDMPKEGWGAGSPAVSEPEPESESDHKGNGSEPQSPKKARAPKKKPEPQSDDIADEVVDPPKTAPGDTLRLEKLKNSLMDSLKEAFKQGKVKEVRKLLSDHGGGAKSFGEVDPAVFPAIDAAIKAGALV